MITSLRYFGINSELDITTSDMSSNYKFYLLKQKNIFKTKEYTSEVTNAETLSKIFIQLEDIGIANASIHKIDHSILEKIQNSCRTNAQFTLKFLYGCLHRLGNEETLVDSN